MINFVDVSRQRKKRAGLGVVNRAKVAWERGGRPWKIRAILLGLLVLIYLGVDAVSPVMTVLFLVRRGGWHVGHGTFYALLLGRKGGERALPVSALRCLPLKYSIRQSGPFWGAIVWIPSRCSSYPSLHMQFFYAVPIVNFIATILFIIHFINIPISNIL